MPAFCAFDLEAWPCCPSVPKQRTPCWARAGALGASWEPAAAWRIYLCSMELPSHPAHSVLTELCLSLEGNGRKEAVRKS